MKRIIAICLVAATLTLGSALCALGRTVPRPADPAKQTTGQALPQAHVEWEPTTPVQQDGIVLLTDPVGQGSLPLIYQALPTPTARISLDVNERIQGALTKLFKQVGQRFELDKDVPANTRVTLRVRNVSFPTALRALLEQADLGWSITTVCAGRVGPALYTISKQPAQLQITPIINPTPAPQNIPWSSLKGNLQTLPNLIETHPILIDGNGSNLFVTPTHDLHLTNPAGTLYHLLQADPAPGAGKPVQVAPPTLVQPVAPDKDAHPKQDGAGVRVPLLGDLPIIGSLFTTRTRTERSIFTCPHCHEQVTVVRSHEAPTCPECGRQFQTDWKVCPFDGAKRPVVAGEWKFCPVCGKSIADSAKSRSSKE